MGPTLMAVDSTSPLSTPAVSEASMTCQLLLTTLAGNELSIPFNVAQHDRFEDLEDYIVTSLDVFGCEVALICPYTKRYLEDPVWDALRDSTSFNMVVLETYQSKEGFE